MKKTSFLSALILVMTFNLCYALTITQVQVMDSAGSARTSFFNTETITMKIEVYNEAQLSGDERIWFKFYVYDPLGVQVFYQEGNSMLGTPGSGGSELRNIPISFYTTPGEYTFKGEAVSGAAAGSPAVSQTVKFTMTSASISLTYPPNGVRDIPANPLIFRWAASGAAKYRVYVADNAAFYRTLWSGDAYTSEITYPENPTDPLAKLASGPVYWWKVEGLDASDRVVATTPVPFSFSIKDVTVTSNDLAVENIKLADKKEEAVGYEDSVMIEVYVKNLGNEAQSNINLDVVVAGGAAIPTITIKTVEQGKAEMVPVDVGPLAGEAATISATISVLDDNPKNNTLTKVIKLPEKRGKILGGVVSKSDKKPVGGATVEYSGATNGKVKTNNGGQYRILNLPYGTYTLFATHPDYQGSDDVKVVINKQNAEPNVDFELNVKGKQVVDATAKEEHKSAMGIDEAWSALKELIKDKGVLEELNGYNIVGMDAVQGVNIGELIEKIKSGKAEILEVKVEKE